MIDRKPAPTPRPLFLQNAVLLDDVIDHLALVSVDPAGEGREEQLEAEDVGHDGGIVPLKRKAVTRGPTVRSNCRTVRAMTSAWSKASAGRSSRQRALAYLS